MKRSWRRSGEARSPRDVWSEWKSADEAGHTLRAGELAEEMLSLAPDSFLAWFEAGLYSKARRDWPAAALRNRRALELFQPADRDAFEGVNPAAWNLGIAATALGDWETAREAWAEFGIDGLARGSGPIDGDSDLRPSA